MRILVLATDAFGGHGGIAKYNRDLLGALCAYPGVSEVVAVPRHAPLPLEPLPSKLTHLTAGLNGKCSYFLAVWRCLLSPGKFDIIWCGHLNLLPLAYLAKLILRAPLIVNLHGIDAWQPTDGRLARLAIPRVDFFASVSELTKRRFLEWAGLEPDRILILPNAVEPQRYGAGEKNRYLLQRYGLVGKTVLLTLGRLAATERYKGIDEVLELLPALVERVPEIAYLVVGDGDDRRRLEEKAGSLGVGDRVVFAGFIEEAEKADHYRLADAYVMPGRGEGFGIVYLEAMACGIPVLGSKLDGSREVLQGGALGILVDPRDRDELWWGILEVLKRPRGVVPPGLSYFSIENYTRRCHDIVSRILPKRGD